MRGKIHRIVGVTTVGAVAILSPQINIMNETLLPVFGLLLADCGSKIADIDLHSSEYGRKHLLLAKIFKHRGVTHSGLVCLVLTALLFMLCKLPVNKSLALVETILMYLMLDVSLVVSLGKRLSHKLLGVTFIFNIAVLIILFFIFKLKPLFIHTLICSSYLGFVIAYVSHIFADMFNRKGVPLLYPLSNKKIHVATVVTGTYQEYIFAVIYTISVMLFIVYI